MSLVDLFHSIATGPARRRSWLTPVGLVVFSSLLLLVVLAGLLTDRVVGMPRLLPGAAGSVIGTVLLAAGLLLCGSCVALFAQAKGTPVPFNPPRQLVVTGLYAWTRNPMLTGAFACLFGLGFLLHSLSIVVVWTPLFVAANAIELKRVEELELERRFGASYVEYRKRVPMFFPKPPASTSGHSDRSGST
jgi:protein-S-isoprenylcysteine O-methyltransferase Ste14